MENKVTYDVIIIGGGATGAGIARDLALRGLKIILLEKQDLAEGTTGRCHGLLHSGGRYVVSDPIAATECADENKILRQIAPHIIDDCDGYFVAFPEDDPEYITKFPEACKKTGVEVNQIGLNEFKKIEPECSEDIYKVFKVNDAYIDPFLLTYYNALDAQNHGGKISNYTKVNAYLIENDRVIGVETIDTRSGEKTNVFGKYVINATGPWAADLEKTLNIPDRINLAPTMGTLVIYDKRLTNSVINRLAYPGDGDIIVPSHQSVIIGTTSIRIPSEQLDHLMATETEIREMEKAGQKILPKLANMRFLRFYSGARPLVIAKGSKQKKEKLSRKFEIKDYEDYGISGLLTVFGGKLTTYRLMAQEISDIVCEKLSIEAECTTHLKKLPGADDYFSKEKIQGVFDVEERVALDMSLKWGNFLNQMSIICDECLNATRTLTNDAIICKCEQISTEELKWARENLFLRRLDDYRRRTRQGMGKCQGQFCLFKMADLESQWSKKSHQEIISELREALEKRWKTEEQANSMLQKQIKLSKYMYLLGGNI